MHAISIYAERFFYEKDFDIFARVHVYHARQLSILTTLHPMKQRLRNQLLLTVSFLLMVPLMFLAQSQSSSEPRPAPYPGLKAKSSPSEVQKQHEKDVQQWKEAERLRNENLKNSRNTSPKPSADKQKRLAEKMAGVAPAKTNGKVNPQHREVKYVNLPGYPAYVFTGNPALDEKNYQLAKAKWMDENKALYEKYIRENKKSDRKLSRPASATR